MSLSPMHAGRRALLLALSAAALLGGGRAEAALATYRWQISNGASVAGLTTNWGTTTCGSQPTVSARVVTTMTASGFACSADRLTDTAAAGTTMLLLVRTSAYAQATRVTGQASGNVWSLQNSNGTGTVTFRFQLGSVSGGAFTPFAGQVDQQVTATQTTYNPNLSALTGTAPAGSSLALQVSLVQTGGSARIYLGTNNAGSGAIQVDETAVGTLTLGNNTGTEASSQTICATGGATDLDRFTLLASAADTVSNVTFTFGGASAASAASVLSSLQVTSDTGAVLGTAASVAATSTVPLNMAAPTATTQYRARVTPNPNVAPGVYTLSGTVTAVADTGAFTRAGSDGASATLTIDAQAQNDVTGAAASAASASAIGVSWTNPAADFASVLIVRRAGAAPTGTPARGQTYAAGAALPGAGAGETVVASGLTASPFADSGLATGTTYFYELFVRDACGNWSAGVTTSATPAAPTLTLADAAAPAGGTVCPGDATVRDLSAFTVGTSPAGTTDTVSSLTVDFTNGGANAGASRALASASITDATGATTYATAASPADRSTFTFTAPNLAATSTATPYRVRFAVGPHGMPAGTYRVTAVVTAATHAASANALSVATTAASSATFVVDNQPPAAPSGLAAVPGSGQVSLSWTNPATDFGGYAIVVRSTGAFSGAPADGTASYAVGATVGNGTVICQGNVSACFSNALSNGTTYGFAVFARDACSNWSPAAAVTATPASNAVVTGTPTASATACNSVTVSAPFTGDPNGNSTITVARDTSPTGAFATTVCSAAGAGGPNPRTCVDGTTAGSSSYYYRVTFADPDGVSGANPQTTALVTTPACAANLVLSSPGPQPAGTLAVGGAATRVGQVTLAASNGTLALASLAVANAAASGAALPGTDVQALTLRDAAGNVLAVSTWNGSRYVFRAPADPSTRQAVQIGASAVTLDVFATAAYGATAGRAFAMSVSAADVVASAVAASGSVSATTGGPVVGATFTVAAPATVAEGDRTLGSTRPGVAVFNPGKGTVVSGSILVQVLVSSPTANGAADVTAVGLSTSGSAPATCAATPGLARNANYDGKVGTSAAIWQKVLTFGAGGDFAAEGTYTLVACAANASGSVASAPVTVTVRKPGTGDGNLLVRDNSSQLCQDCHAVQTHSSGNTSNKYGSWTVNCRDCHDPHKTRNLFLLREQITPPAAAGTYLPAQPVYFANRNGDSSAVGPGGGAAAPGNSSYVNSDQSGPCQVCHTRTSSADGTLARWRNAGAGGNVDAHNVGLNDTSGAGGCTGCHSHANGFKAGESAGGAACSACHQAIWAGATNTGAGAKASKHTIGGVVGTNDSPSDTGLAWNTVTTLRDNAPSARSCAMMCHGDHTHDLPGTATTHEYNAYADATTRASRGNATTPATKTTATRARTDFDAAQANGGMCVSCHQKPVAAGSPTIDKATYGASAHNYTGAVGAAGAWTYTQHDGGQFQRNCTKCHSDRNDARPGDATQPFGAVHFSDYPKLLAGVVNPATVNGAVDTARRATFVCYNCHGNATVGANLSGKDIATQIAKASGHPADQDAVHANAEQANAAFGTQLGAAAGSVARHAACEDCHDPHAAKPTSTTARAQGNATTGNLAGAALEGAWGVKLGGTLAAWTAPAAANFTKVTLTAASGTPAAGKDNVQASLCLKCHSAYYWGAGTPPTSPSGGFAGTDVAQEFNPANVAYHPVLASSSAKLGNTANVLAPWSRTSLMVCTDCHASDAAADPNGPHGSTAKFVLKGPNTLWDATLTLSSAGMPAGTFCANCHSASFAGSRFPAHTTQSNHRGLPCFNCHTPIVHGAPRPGFLVAAAGADTGVPARTAYDTSAPYNQSTTGNKLWLKSYPASNTTNWQQSNCACNSTNNH